MKRCRVALVRPYAEGRSGGGSEGKHGAQASCGALSRDAAAGRRVLGRRCTWGMDVLGCSMSGSPVWLRSNRSKFMLVFVVWEEESKSVCIGVCSTV